MYNRIRKIYDSIPQIKKVYDSDQVSVLDNVAQEWINMKRTVRLCGVLVLSVLLGASIQPVLAGIYGSFCDPSTITTACPGVCSNQCQVFGSPSGTVGPCATAAPGNLPGPLRKLCMDAFFTTCAGRTCPASGWYCAGIVPPPGATVGFCVCADPPSNSC